MGRGGYWEPHTSSIDFCEDNYRFTIYVAELLNSLSSLPITLAGAWSWAITPLPYRDWPRFGLCWAAFIVVGLGSVLFHATLRRPAQALDEVPMVLANLAFVYVLSLPEPQGSPKLAWALGATGVAMVLIYTVWEAYVVFFFLYGGFVVYLIIASRIVVFQGKASERKVNGACNRDLLQRIWWMAFTTYALGFALWCIDHLACSQLGVGHLHIVWHFLGCGGTLLFCLLLVALTANLQGHKVHLRWLRLVVPVLPYLVLEEGKSS